MTFAVQTSVPAARWLLRLHQLPFAAIEVVITMPFALFPFLFFVALV